MVRLNAQERNYDGRQKCKGGELRQKETRMRVQEFRGRRWIYFIRPLSATGTVLAEGLYVPQLVKDGDNNPR